MTVKLKLKDNSNPEVGYRFGIEASEAEEHDIRTVLCNSSGMALIIALRDFDRGRTDGVCSEIADLAEQLEAPILEILPDPCEGKSDFYRRCERLRKALQELYDRFTYHCAKLDGSFDPPFVKEWYEIAKRALKDYDDEKED